MLFSLIWKSSLRTKIKKKLTTVIWIFSTCKIKIVIVLKLWNRDSPSMQIWTSNSLNKLVTKSSAISLPNINHSHKKSIFNSNNCLLVIYITVYCITHINFYICGEMYWRKWHINTKVTCVIQWFLPLLLNNIYVLI